MTLISVKSVADQRSCEILVVGAGPHALTVAAHLCRRDPSWASRMLVTDPSGRWLSQWDATFDRLGITHLRSPTVHHPHPDPHAISKRGDLEREDLTPGGYQRPSRRAFDLTVRDTIAEFQLDDAVLAASVVGVEAVGGRFVVDLDDGSTISTSRVVIATNRRTALLPDGMEPHEAVPDVRDVRQGERVVVVGGGLTAVQLVDQVLAHNGRPIMITRRELVARHFDVDPGWMGPKYLDGFELIEDSAERVATARSARGGGTVPPGDLERLRGLVDSGMVELHEANAVVSVERVGSEMCVCLSDGRLIRGDRVVAATGSLPSVQHDPLVSAIVGLVGVDVGNDLPVPDEHLRLGGSSIHVTGGLATVQLGPAAGNLSGARRAAQRIVASICGENPLEADPGLSADLINGRRRNRVRRS